LEELKSKDNKKADSKVSFESPVDDVKISEVTTEEQTAEKSIKKRVIKKKVGKKQEITEIITVQENNEEPKTFVSIRMEDISNNFTGALGKILVVTKKTNFRTKVLSEMI
jgi:hypothetical protein